MNRTALTTMILLVTAATLPTPATASGGCGDVTTIALGVHILYMDDRSEGAGDIDHWFYLESNGIDGLQTGGAWPFDPDGILPGFYDACFSSEAHTTDTYLI